MSSKRIEAKIDETAHARAPESALEREAAKLDPSEEQALADEIYIGELFGDSEY